MSTLKVTPLHSIHLQLGARMAKFAGWDMPVQYRGIIEEHTATRTQAGLFDTCHMGEFVIQGERAAEFLQYITVNDVSRLAVGQCHYSAMCNEQGGVLDDLVLYRIDATKYMMVVNAGTRERDFKWLLQHNCYEVDLEDVSDKTGKLDVQGPQAAKILRVLVDPTLVDNLRYYHFVECDIAGHEAIVSRTGYTGERGYELYVIAHETEALWKLVLEKGRAWGLQPAGLGARDTLRLEMGYHLYGHELSADTSALEAGLGWIVKPDKGAFIGREALLKQKAEGLARELVAFEMQAKAVPRAGCTILTAGKETGTVTSGSFAPSLGKPVGLGYMSLPLKPDSLEIEIRKKPYPAHIVDLPFYKNGSIKD